MERKEVVAFLIDAAAESILSYKDYGPAGAAVIGPDGRKHVFTAEQLAKAELAMGMTETSSPSTAPSTTLRSAQGAQGGSASAKGDYTKRIKSRRKAK